MCLEELSENDKLWRQIAFKICGCKTQADELVQQMYIRWIEYGNGAEWNEYYVALVLRSCFLNNLKTNKLVNVSDSGYFHDKTFGFYEQNSFEPDDYEQGLLDKVEELTYNQRELLELSYDYSLRGIQERFGVNYLYAHRELKKARKHILNGDIDKYQNSRLKYRNMAKQEKQKNEQKTAEYYEKLDKRSREYQTYMAGKEAAKAELAKGVDKKQGLGDRVEKVIEKVLPEGIVSVIKQADCGCDDRKAWLNEKGRSWRDAVSALFNGLEKPKAMTPEQMSDYGKFVRNRKFTVTGTSNGTGRIEPNDVHFVCELYAEVFSRELWKPTCSSCQGEVSRVASFIYKLDTVYYNSIEAA